MHCGIQVDSVPSSRGGLEPCCFLQKSIVNRPGCALQQGWREVQEETWRGPPQLSASRDKTGVSVAATSFGVQP